jgi:signal peptidase I
MVDGIQGEKRPLTPAGEAITNGPTSKGPTSKGPGEGAAKGPLTPTWKQQWHKEIQEGVSFLKTLAIFLIAAFILRATVVEAFKIPSGSMLPTLQIGDHLLVSKLSYGIRLPFVTNSLVQFAQPRRHDIVVFTRPDDIASIEDDSSINIIKRVVALPGETVVVRGTKVFINNQLLSEPFAQWEENGIREGDFGPERVPADHVFLLGDNRDHSKDSRFWEQPFLPISRIKGRALVIYWSWDSLNRIGTVIE